MKLIRCLIFAAFLPILYAKDKPKAEKADVASLEKKTAALQAEIESLKAQLQVSRLELAYEKQVCVQPDLLQARLAALAADQKLKAAVAASTKPTAEPAAPAESSTPTESGSQTKEKR